MIGVFAQVEFPMPAAFAFLAERFADRDVEGGLAVGEQGHDAVAVVGSLIDGLQLLRETFFEADLFEADVLSIRDGRADRSRSRQRVR